MSKATLHVLPFNIAMMCKYQVGVKYQHRDKVMLGINVIDNHVEPRYPCKVDTRDGLVHRWMYGINNQYQLWYQRIEP